MIVEGKEGQSSMQLPSDKLTLYMLHDFRYYSDCQEKAPSEATMSEADAKRLWEVSEKLVGLDKREDGWTGQKDEVGEESQAVD